MVSRRASGFGGVGLSDWSGYELFGISGSSIARVWPNCSVSDLLQPPDLTIVRCCCSSRLTKHTDRYCRTSGSGQPGRGWSQLFGFGLPGSDQCEENSQLFALRPAVTREAVLVKNVTIVRYSTQCVPGKWPNKCC